MNIIIYDSTDAKAMTLPVIPKEVKVNSPQDIKAFNTIGQGDIQLSGLMGNREIEIKSFFPSQNNSQKYVKSFELIGMACVSKLEDLRTVRKPVYLSIDDLNIAFRCIVSSFEYGIVDGSGDIDYTMKIKEYIRSETYVRKTTEGTTTSSTSTITPMSDASAPLSGDAKLNLHSAPSISAPKIKDALKTLNRIKVYRNIGKDWSQIKGGYMKTSYLKSAILANK